jgi:2-dehydro-3-deoxygluconokinase
MDLVTFGEAMVRLTPPAYQRLEQAHSFDAYVGGGELNVAVAASRLGVMSRWVSRLPDNALGHMIANRAHEHGVDVRAESTVDGRAGLYFAELGAAPRASSVLYDRADSAMSGVAPGTIDWASVFDGARWFHVSGITPALSDSAAKVTEESLIAAKAAGLTVSYDLNYRGKLWSGEKARAVQEPLMEYVDVLMTTEEDTRVVFGIGEGKDNYEHLDAEPYDKVALALQKRFGFQAVAITLRENPLVWLNSWSAIIAADGEIHRAPRYEVEVVDRIGAGDAFCAGLIVSRLENHGWDDAVRFATATSALKHTIPGDFCLVTSGEVENLLRGASLRVSR